MTVLGIDYGTKRIGVSVCHDGTRVAVAVCAVDGRESLKKSFAPLFAKYQPGLIVIGNPLNLYGNPGKMSEKATRFAAKIKAWFGIECLLWDERYSSSQADRSPGGYREKGDRDISSAVLILQSYIDNNPA